MLTNELSIYTFAKRDLLIPLCDLSDNDRRLVFEKAVIRAIEPRTLISEDDDLMMFLLEGEVTMLSSGFVAETFIHTDHRALRALFNDGLEEDSVLFSSHGTLLEINKALFNGLYMQSQANAIEQSETELSDSEEEIFQHLFFAFKNKKLDLPLLPEAALKIRKAVNSFDVGSQEIIDIVQTDAVLTARLLKVSNSPLYGTWREIKTIKDAVRRLGVEATRNLSFSLSVHQLYKAKTSLIKKEMLNLYALTRRISSLGFIVTKDFCEHLDGEQTVLAGLLQGIGILPILMHIDANPSLAQSNKQLAKSVDKLKLPISALLFNEWNFPPHFIEYIEHSDDWHRDVEGDVDYCDILIVARLLCLYENKDHDIKLPDFEKLAVFHKIGFFDAYDTVENYLRHTRNDVSSMDSLLN